MNSKYMYFDTKAQAQEYIDSFGTNRPDISFSGPFEGNGVAAIFVNNCGIIYRVLVTEHSVN